MEWSQVGDEWYTKVSYQGKECLIRVYLDLHYYTMGDRQPSDVSVYVDLLSVNDGWVHLYHKYEYYPSLEKQNTMLEEAKLYAKKLFGETIC